MAHTPVERRPATVQRYAEYTVRHACLPAVTPVLGWSARGEAPPHLTVVVSAAAVSVGALKREMGTDIE